MSQLQVIARYTAAAGEDDEVADLVIQLAAASRTEPGNIDFTAYRQLDDARRFVLLERYASRDALDAHRDTPHFTDLVLGRLVPRLDSRVVETYDVPDDQNEARS
ncbi:MAG: antibiotic biosynthesis monooxygenase [Pseudonocardia sp.]|nr:antibiotic biosynthesis monooxygenase [Pseudonocardia sp.]